MINYRPTGPRSPRWDLMPDYIWYKVLEGFFYKISDGVAFWCRKPEDIQKFECFKDWQPEFIDFISYRPESTPSTVTDYYSYQEKIPVFKFDLNVLSRLLRVPFDAWRGYYDNYPTDEIVFFKDRVTKGRAVPYESQIWFENLTNEEFDIIQNIDEAVRKNLLMLDDKTKKLVQYPS